MERIEIENILDEIGVPLNIKGYRYIIEAVIYINKYPFELIGNIYIDLAKQFEETPSRIERNIRYACEKYEKDISNYLELKCKINNEVLIKAIERKVRRNKEKKNIKEREEV